MSQTSVRQSAFSSGELSDRMLGRTDLPQYKTGLREMQRFLLQPQGSATRCPGFQYLGTAKAITFPSATLQASGTGNFGLFDIAYAQQIGTFGRWVAVGANNGTNPVIIISDNSGVTWTTAGTIPAKNFSLNAISWSGSLFVAVGNTDGSNAIIFTSPDGNTWTSQSSGAGSIGLYGVAWTGSAFVAVGDGGVCRTSADGVTWAAGTGLSASISYRGITVNSSELVAVGAGSAGTTPGSVYHSTNNGSTWTVGTAVLSGFGGLRAAIYWNGAYYICGGDGIVLSGDFATSKARVEKRTSITGTPTTVFVGANTTTHLSAMFVVGSYLVAVGASGEFAFTLDGTTWSETTIGATALNGISATAAGFFIAVGSSSGANAVIYTQASNTYVRRVYPFIGSTGQPYMMEVGHLYVRFWRPNSAGVISQVQSSPGVPLEVTTPYNAVDLTALQFAQANDILYIAHPNYAPRKLTRTSETAFTLTNLMDSSAVTTDVNTSTYKFVDGPYLDENGTVTTFTLSATGTGAKTLTSSVAIFTANDVGRIVRLRAVAAGSLWGYGVITAFTSTTVVTIFMILDPSTSAATTRWALGAWGNTPGFPTTVTFYQQRACWGGTAAGPMDVKASVTAAFETFNPTQLDDTTVADNAVYFTIASQRMSAIRWMAGKLSLAIGTKGGVYFADGGATISAAYGAPIAPGSVNIRLASEYDCDAPIAASVGDIICYVQQGGRKIRALQPSSTGNTYSQPDLTMLAEHISRTGILEIVFAATPNAVIWGRRTDGQLIGLTMSPDVKEVGWHEHPLAGTLSGATTPLVMSVASLPIYGHDQLFIATRRTINGAQVEFIEALQLPFDSLTNTLSQAWYLDAAVQYSGAATTAISGLSHLEGQVVYAMADGIKQGPFTVASGAITLTVAASLVTVGLDYSSLSQIETMPARMPGQQTSQGLVTGDGAIVSIDWVVLEVMDTRALKLGADATHLFDVDKLTALTTDFIKVAPIADDGALLTSVVIEPDGPYPATLTGLTLSIGGEPPP